ncbi:anti-anti-sigma regulatory factor [Saccharopolyspora lacisalsi]|uniref:Anti-anti-sigma regulatory factor n=1 Tax=Halosaccharopolyspora lacisalsi TaxID=1000566 RepID=A0A839E5E4_9PSEU|nr:MEDS domain-containing protein [Halosaccharopolyspora lacisalsi]MBA8827075.1 anti-anti-sigma regulatory factor [Halosaccharopolyspora lacisalsi]
MCWASTSRTELHARAAQYLLDGITAGQWIEYVGTGSTEGLRAELAEHEALNEVLTSGGIAVTPVEDFHALETGNDTVDPEAAVTARIAATKQALAEGYTGFRAVVDATAVAITPQQRAAFVRFEHLIEHATSALPVTALCGHNLAELGDTATAELACLHPLTNLEVPFQLFADHDGTLTLTGTIDQTCAELLTHALGTAAALAPDHKVTLNARALTFIEPDRLLALDHLAREHDRTIVLRNAPPAVTRLLQQLPLTHLTNDAPQHT